MTSAPWINGYPGEKSYWFAWERMGTSVIGLKFPMGTDQDRGMFWYKLGWVSHRSNTNRLGRSEPMGTDHNQLHVTTIPTHRNRSVPMGILTHGLLLFFGDWFGWVPMSPIKPNEFPIGHNQTFSPG